MLPCKEHCNHYSEGCHKTCGRWRARCMCEKMQRERKRNYLKLHEALCRETVLRCRENTVCRAY